jgi:conjugal transfer pilus assembly protein TraK
MKPTKNIILTLSLFVIAFNTIGGGVEPDKPTTVTLSNRDVNRVVCVNGRMEDAYYSQEKGVSVSIDGDNAFIKFSIEVTGEKKRYVRERSEFHLVCDAQVYTLLGKPLNTSGKIIYLGDMALKDIKENVSNFAKESLEEKGRKLIIAALQEKSGGLPGHIKESKPLKTTWRIIDLKGPSELESQKIKIALYRSLKVSGIGLTLKEYRVIPEKEQYLDERRFLNARILKNPFQITVEPMHVQANQESRLYVVEHSIN